MNKKLSNKDLKDWKNFLESKEKIHNKDNVINQTNFKEEATIDLHGFSLQGGLGVDDPTGVYASVGGCDAVINTFSSTCDQ